MTKSAPPALLAAVEYLADGDQSVASDSANELPGTPSRLLQRYRDTIAELESAIWSSTPSDIQLALYQQLFREMEQQIAASGEDRRHNFIVVIPVADRPQHLESCLGSLLTLCERFHYGRDSNGRYAKIRALIADDTKEAANIAAHRDIARRYNRLGLETLYFGLPEQLQLLEEIPQEIRASVKGIIGDNDPAAFFHKGPSVMRNITYLMLNRLGGESDNTLFFFIDSDQEFQVKIPDGDGERNVYAVNYLYELDRIFSSGNCAVVTGKVVGDPPVSPAVMSGNFLEDVFAFLQQLAHTEPEGRCGFHHELHGTAHDAAYHDMADLFGFKPSGDPYRYRCTLEGDHDHAACFRDFAARLNSFFYGEHPTRKSYYQYDANELGVTPARTIYTGNYVFKPELLQHFIPFADLRLRMAGPVLGRLIRAELGKRFISANLPMLHKRTLEQSGQSEFRPGVEQESERVDLSGEFERQFYGDVMLFTMEKLTVKGYPITELPHQTISQALAETQADMLGKYRLKRETIQYKLGLLNTLFHEPEQWWNLDPELEGSRRQFRHFIDNIEHNFGADSPCLALIKSESNKDARLDAMSRAIARYTEDRENWRTALSEVVGRNP